MSVHVSLGCEEQVSPGEPVAVLDEVKKMSNLNKKQDRRYPRNRPVVSSRDCITVNGESAFEGVGRSRRRHSGGNICTAG